MESIRPFTFIIFGGTGDLAIRKLIPALYNLYVEKQLQVPFSVIGISRKPKTHQEFRNFFIEGVKMFSRNGYAEELYKKMASSFYYISGDLHQQKTYQNLRDILYSIEGEHKNRLFYMATNPEYFPVVVENLTAFGILKKGTIDPWHRIIIEKPFGTDLTSARKLNQQLRKMVEDDQMFRIDHYLGKEAVQNFMVLRFANGIFEPLWNNHHVDYIQMTVSETVGVGNRGAYYEKAGATRDMLQNHILQLLSLIAMEPPVDFSAESVSAEKIKVIRALRLFEDNSIVRGQYQGYTEEDKVNPFSNVETFIAAKLEIHNWRWAGVPIYVRTGKYLQEKMTEIVVHFKKTPYNLYGDSEQVSNKLAISVEPNTGFSLQFNVKEPARNNMAIRPVKMNFCHVCEFGKNTPEAYERLLLDAALGDATLFTSWKEIEYSWILIDEIMQKSNGQKPHIYFKGSWGPTESFELLKKDEREWYYSNLRCDNAYPCGNGCVQK